MSGLDRLLDIRGLGSSHFGKRRLGGWIDERGPLFGGAWGVLSVEEKLRWQFHRRGDSTNRSEVARRIWPRIPWSPNELVDYALSMLSQRRWKPESAIALLFGLFFSVGIGMLCTSAVQRFLPRLTEADRLFATLVVNAVCIQGAALLLVHFALRQNEIRWNDFLGLTLPDLPRSLGLALLVGVLAVPFALILNKLCFDLFRWLGHNPAEQAMIKILQQESSWGRRSFQFFVAVVIAPLAEESVFRGILYSVIRQEGHPRLALWLSAFIFASIHVNLLTFVPLLVLGLILARLYERTGCLLAPILTHSFFNLVNFILLLFQVDLDRLGDVPS